MMKIRLIALIVALAGVLGGGVYSDVNAAAKKAPLQKAPAQKAPTKKARAKKPRRPRPPKMLALKVRALARIVGEHIKQPNLWQQATKEAQAAMAKWKQNHGRGGAGAKPAGHAAAKPAAQKDKPVALAQKDKAAAAAPAADDPAEAGDEAASEEGDEESGGEDSGDDSEE